MLLLVIWVIGNVGERCLTIRISLFLFGIPSKLIIVSKFFCSLNWKKKILIHCTCRFARTTAYIFFVSTFRKMYWADWSRKRPKIEVANMDGSDRRVLVKYPLSLPNGLTLVQSTNELCYSDAGLWSISCVNLGDLSMRKAYYPAPYPFGITNFNRSLFWTDWKLGRIQRLGLNSKFPDKPLRSFVGSNGKIFDIKAVQPCGRTGKGQIVA